MDQLRSIGEEGGLNLCGFVGNSLINAWDEYGLAPGDKLYGLP